MTIPPTQHAALRLVLDQGLSYERIGSMLRIEPATVRERVHLGIGTLIGTNPSEHGPEQDALVIDYLVGQQTLEQREATMRRLAEDEPLRLRAHAMTAALRAAGEEPLVFVPRTDPPRIVGPTEASTHVMSVAAGVPSTPVGGGSDAAPARRRGSPLLLAGVLAVVALVILFVFVLDGEDRTTDRTTATAPAPPATGTLTAPGASATGPVIPAAEPDVVAATRGAARQITLIPAQPGTAAGGSATVVPTSGRDVLTINTQGLAAVEGSAFAVWLEDAQQRAELLGFVATPLDSGQGFTAGVKLPKEASRFTTLLVTQESTEGPTKPGTPVLTAAFALK